MGVDGLDARAQVARMLDFMWLRGQVGIADRAGGQRLWDLMERCRPAGVEVPEPPPDRELTRRAALLAIGALGAARSHFGSMPGGHIKNFSLGPTATREVGLYLGLPHTFEHWRVKHGYSPPQT